MIPGKMRKPTMLTTDVALRFDPEYEKISRRFLNDPQAFAEAFARAWFKLTHRDLGPRSRYLGPEVPKEELIWQDPVPAADHPLIDDADASALKAKIIDSGLTVSELVGTAWASASNFRGGDKRGGANGARIRLAPQKDWEVNQPLQLAKVLEVLKRIQADFNQAATGGKKVSLADLIVLAGNAGIEQAAKAAGQDVSVPFAPGRTDASAGTDRCRVLRLSRAGGRRLPQLAEDPLRGARRGPADRQGATADAHAAGTDGADGRPACHQHQCRRLPAWRLHRQAGRTDQRLLRQPARHGHGMEADLPEAGRYSRGATARSGEVKWTGTRVDLVFGSNSVLRALAEVYASSDAKEKFVNDFVAAWTKVMNADRFDLAA